MTPTKWKTEQASQKQAGLQADAIVRRLNMDYPIDPIEIAKDEQPRLRVGGRDFGDRFDGKLRYVSDKRCFALMFNTKYDVGYSQGQHHPRTRFSISHELGHYFIEGHHSYLVHGGRPHSSINEFRSKIVIERQADAFAASLLLPTHLVKPIVNSCGLSVPRLKALATDFQTSLVSTAIRSVQLSHFPCALAGIRDGSVAWTFLSDSLASCGIYSNKGILPKNATAPWADFQLGVSNNAKAEGQVRDWFQTYERHDLGLVYVSEEYIPVQSMGTLLVLLTMDEQDIYSDDD